MATDPDPKEAQKQQEKRRRLFIYWFCNSICFTLSMLIAIGLANEYNFSYL
jgi:hypothetical protein